MELCSVRYRDVLHSILRRAPFDVALCSLRVGADPCVCPLNVSKRLLLFGQTLGSAPTVRCVCYVSISQRTRGIYIVKNREKRVAGGGRQETM